MGGPHPCRQTFAADVTEGKNYAGVCFLYGEEVTGHMANGENLTGDLEVVIPDQTRGAETPRHLRSFDELAMQVGVVLL